VKNVALTHWSASALSTIGVVRSQGPSSKVSTTSLFRRKSCCLKCSKPKPGPPVVSISTVRETPKASGLSQRGAATRGGGGGAAAGAGADAGTRARAGGGAAAGAGAAAAGAGAAAASAGGVATGAATGGATAGVGVLTLAEREVTGAVAVVG